MNEIPSTRIAKQLAWMRLYLEMYKQALPDARLPVQIKRRRSSPRRFSRTRVSSMRTVGLCNQVNDVIEIATEERSKMAQLRTLAHELAHLEGLGHGPDHDRRTAEICQLFGADKWDKKDLWGRWAL